MAKSPGAPAPSQNPLLPLAEPLLKHHLETLQRSMEQWIAQKRVPPVLLISGPSGIGKRSVVHFLSQWLLCERGAFAKPAEGSDEGSIDLFGFGPPPEAAGTSNQAPALAPCGECAACQRALSGNWVDFTEISVDSGNTKEESSSDSIKIEHFRKLKSSLGFGAFSGSYKINFVRDAEKMTLQAANSLLKVLEEPPPGWIFFLTATDPCLLLPTIVSRCQVLRLKPLPSTALKELLAQNDIPADRREVCAELAQGSWGRAMALADPEVWEKRKAVLHFLERPTAEINALTEWGSQENQNFNILLDQLEQVTQNLLHWTLTRKFFACSELSESRALTQHADTLVKRCGSIEAARNFWIERARKIFHARQVASAPLNRKLLIQDILLPWLGHSAE